MATDWQEWRIPFLSYLHISSPVEGLSFRTCWISLSPFGVDGLVLQWWLALRVRRLDFFCCSINCYRARWLLLFPLADCELWLGLVVLTFFPSLSASPCLGGVGFVLLGWFIPLESRLGLLLAIVTESGSFLLSHFPLAGSDVGYQLLFFRVQAVDPSFALIFSSLSRRC